MVPQDTIVPSSEGHSRECARDYAFRSCSSGEGRPDRRKRFRAGRACHRSRAVCACTSRARAHGQPPLGGRTGSQRSCPKDCTVITERRAPRDTRRAPLPRWERARRIPRPAEPPRAVQRAQRRGAERGESDGPSAKPTASSSVRFPCRGLHQRTHPPRIHCQHFRCCRAVLRSRGQKSVARGWKGCARCGRCWGTNGSYFGICAGFVS